MKGQEDIIQGIRKRLEELEVRDKKREMALETANLLLDKELERVSNFVEEKVSGFVIDSRYIVISLQRIH